MNISIIVAVAKNGGIGYNNKLLWHLPNDLKFFKQTTWAMPVVMGRKTFESLGNKPLNGRLNIVITSQKNYEATGAVVVNNLEDAIFVATEHNYKELFIIGGGEIYKQALPKADKIYVTHVNTAPEADTFFELDASKWQLVFKDDHKADDKHAFDYSFATYIKK